MYKMYKVYKAHEVHKMWKMYKAYECIKCMECIKCIKCIKCCSPAPQASYGPMGLYPPLSKLGKGTATTNQIVFGCFAETRRGIHYFRVLCPCLVRLSSCVAHFLFLLQKQQKSMLWGTDPPPHENLGYPWTRGEVPQVTVPPPSPFPMGIHVF